MAKNEAKFEFDFFFKNTYTLVSTVIQMKSYWLIFIIVLQLHPTYGSEIIQFTQTCVVLQENAFLFDL